VNRTMWFMERRTGRTILVCGVIGLLASPANAVELKPKTVAGFDRYIRATEQRMENDSRDGRFLIIDRLPDAARQQACLQLRQGRVYTEELHTNEDSEAVGVPGGLIHHWVGIAFIPRATIAQVQAVLQDYDNHKNTYKPDVRNSKLLERNGNEFKVYLQLYRKSLVTVVVNINLEVFYSRVDANREMSKAYSTRIAEVADPGKPSEHELPVGNDHGYIWRLYTYWRIEEKDGGVYAQVESVGLSRTIPWAIAWLVKPLTKSIPRDILSRLLIATRTAVNSTL